MSLYVTVLCVLITMIVQVESFSIASFQNIDARYKNIVNFIKVQEKMWIRKHQLQLDNNVTQVDQSSSNITIQLQNTTQFQQTYNKQTKSNKKTHHLQQSSDNIPQKFKFRKQYQTFIYPYEVYLVFDQSHQVLERSFENFRKKIQEDIQNYHSDGGLNHTNLNIIKKNKTNNSTNLKNSNNQKQTQSSSQQWQQSQQKNQTQNKDINQKRAAELKKLRNLHISPPPFVMFIKIQKCKNKCQLLKLLPKNVLFVPTQPNQFIKIHKITQSDFIIESIVKPYDPFQFTQIVQQDKNSSKSNQPQQNISDLAINSSQTPNKNNKKKNTYSANIWLYNINVNNYLFYKYSQQEPIIRGYDRLMVGSKVIEIKQEKQSWDVAYNGSAFRLVKHKKQLFIEYLQKNRTDYIQIKNYASQRLIHAKLNNTIPIKRQKIQIPSQLSIQNTSYAQNKQNISNKTINIQNIQYMNTYQVVQYGINQNFQNKPYEIKFFTREYLNDRIGLFQGYSDLDLNNQLRKFQMMSSMQVSFRRNLIGSDRNGNFHLYFNQYKGQTQKLTNIFKSTLKKISLIQQIDHIGFSFRNSSAQLEQSAKKTNKKFAISWENSQKIQKGFFNLRSKQKQYLLYLSEDKKSAYNRTPDKNNKTTKQKQFIINIKQVINKKSSYLTSYLKQLTKNIIFIDRYYQRKSLCKLSIKNFTTDRIFIQKLTQQYFVLCKYNQQNDYICHIFDTLCHQIYNFTIYISAYIQQKQTQNTSIDTNVDSQKKYSLRWQHKQCIIYQYETQIELKILSQFSSKTQKYEKQQTYIKLYIDKHRLDKYHADIHYNNNNDNYNVFIEEQIHNGNNSRKQHDRNLTYQYNNTIRQNIIEQLLEIDIQDYIIQYQNTIHRQILRNITNQQTQQQQQYSQMFNTSDFGNISADRILLQTYINGTSIINISSFYPSLADTNTSQSEINSTQYQNFSLTDWQRNLPNRAKLDQTQINLLQKSSYFELPAYKNRSMYRYLYGSKLLDSKLLPILRQFSVMIQTHQQQEDNCRLLWDQRRLIETDQYLEGQISRDGYRVRRLLGIQFKNPAWEICRISIDSGHQNLVISPKIQQKQIKTPYRIFRCSLQNSSISSKCYYNEEYINKSLILHPNSKSILLILNLGQVYDLTIQDLSSMEMDKITQSFVIMFICLMIVFVCFLSIFMCRRLCVLGRLYLGWVESEAQPRFRYPLNCLQLRLKLRRMKTLRIIRQMRQPNNHHQMNQNQFQIEGDDCVFCLQSKESEQMIIQTYCKHSYHKQCFSQWVRQQSTLLSCPMCKRKLNFQGLNRYIEETGSKIGKSQIQIQ